MRTHGRPAWCKAGKQTTLSSTTTSGLHLVEDLAQAVVDVPRAVAQRAPRRLDELRQLLDRRLAEDGRRVADEVLPELARLLLLLRRRPEPHEALLEALRLEVAGERLLHDEHDPVTALAEHLPDPDAVVGRAVGAFGEEHDRRALCHAVLSSSVRSRTANLREAPLTFNPHLADERPLVRR